ncbi:MAG: hypothetical protein A2048_03845 [Deltaproteobacteria bacterium GWA2_45_12]|nr:MAG: hypothetical protein A2048_03845 [Deltaproteobacteria bacterium GWA2_45_12]
MHPEKSLPKDVQKLFSVLLQHFIPPPPDLNLDGIERSINHILARYILALSPLLRYGLLILLKFFEWGPFFFGFGLIRFSNLNFNLQLKYIDKWNHSRVNQLREFLNGVRGMIMAAAMMDKRIWEYVGYAPEEHIHEKIKQHEQLMSSMEV